MIAGGAALGGLSGSIHLGLANGGREFTGNASTAQRRCQPGAPPPKGVGWHARRCQRDRGQRQRKTRACVRCRTSTCSTLLSIPETHDMTDLQAAAVIPRRSISEKRRAFYIVDAPAGKTVEHRQLFQWRHAAVAQRGGAYLPAVKLVDPLTNCARAPWRHPGTLAGIYARTDASRGVWKAPRIGRHAQRRAGSGRAAQRPGERADQPQG